MASSDASKTDMNTESQVASVTFQRNAAVEQSAVDKLHYTPAQVKRKTIAQLQQELADYVQGTNGTHGAKDTHPTRSKSDKKVSFSPPPAVSSKSHSMQSLKFPKLPSGGRRVQRPRMSASSASASSSSSSSYLEEEDGDSSDEDSVKRLSNVLASGRHAGLDRGRRVLRNSGGSIKSTKESVVDHADLRRLHKLYRAKCNFTRQLEHDEDFTEDDLKLWQASVDRTRDRLKRAMKEAHLDPSVVDHKQWQRREEKIAEMNRMGLLDEQLLRAWREKQDFMRDIYELED